MRAEARRCLALLWRGGVLPVLCLMVALLAIGNVSTAAGFTQSAADLLAHTRAEYAQNGLDFEADLARPAEVERAGADQSIGNLARYDYDSLSRAIVELAPASTPEEVLRYFSFLIFPAITFLLGCWVAVATRRYGVEKIVFARAGTARAVAGRHGAVAASAALILAVAMVVDLVARAVARSLVGQSVDLGGYPPLPGAATSDPLAQWGVAVLALAFFGSAGVLAGALAGGFAIPAVVFLVANFVVPILGAHDPRNWFAVLGHAVFRFDTAFALAMPVPLPPPVAAALAAGVTLAMIGAAYAAVRLRNPLAS